MPIIIVEPIRHGHVKVGAKKVLETTALLNLRFLLCLCIWSGYIYDTRISNFIYYILLSHFWIVKIEIFTTKHQISATTFARHANGRQNFVHVAFGLFVRTEHVTKRLFLGQRADGIAGIVRDHAAFAEQLENLVLQAYGKPFVRPLRYWFVKKQIWNPNWAPFSFRPSHLHAWNWEGGGTGRATSDTFADLRSTTIWKPLGCFWASHKCYRVVSPLNLVLNIKYTCNICNF